MNYITSRAGPLPDTPEEMGAGTYCHLWSAQLWPYRELASGDTLYWYDRKSRAIVWKSEVADVDRFSYQSKDEVLRRLRLRHWFGRFDEGHPYYEQAPASGYCVAYKVQPLKRLSLEKPEGLRFPRIGWMRGDHPVALDWLAASRG